MRSISEAAACVLHIGLPVIILELAAFVRMLWWERQQDAVYALARYPLMLEHIMMSLTLLVIGAFLFDYIARHP